LKIVARNEGLSSNLVARSPNSKTECRDQSDHDEHPVLAFNPEKAEFLNQKLHGAPLC
jgi:hypothetical protein